MQLEMEGEHCFSYKIMALKYYDFLAQMEKHESHEKSDPVNIRDLSSTQTQPIREKTLELYDGLVLLHSHYQLQQ